MIQAGTDQIRDMFNELVPEYDQFNTLTSLGLDSVWRKKVARMFDPGAFVCDVGTGTGELAMRLHERGAHVVGVDFSEAMVSSAREKFEGRSNVTFQVASADELPFEPRTFNGMTSAFVIRNLNQAKILSASFKEFYRVLKSDGQMIHLELTRPTQKWMSLGHRAYLKTVLPFIGKTLFRQRWPKDYLTQTIDQFPPPEQICSQMRWAGFERVCHYPLSGGIAGLFLGTRC